MSSSLGARSGVNTNALAREIASDHKLSHVAIPPKDTGLRDESNALSSIKGEVIAAAAQHGTKGLHHVDAPHDGLSDGVKQAYLEEHSGGQAGMQKGINNCSKGCQSGQCKC